MEAVGTPLITSHNPVDSHEHSPAPASLNIQSTSTNEWHNLDSFDVDPASGRWTETVSGGVESSVDNSIFNITNHNTGPTEYYIGERPLRDLAGIIETRFKIDMEGTTTTNDYFQLQIHKNGDQYKMFGLYMNFNADAAYVTTAIHWRDEDGSTYRMKSLSGNERVWDEQWYKLRFDYDLPVSEFKIELYYDNGTKVFEYNEYDFSTRPFLFETNEIVFSMKHYGTTNGCNASAYVDYVKAPFAEQRWRHIHDDTDPEWLEKDAWNHVYFEDDIETPEYQEWHLNVPNLDHMSGVLRLDTDHSQFINDDYILIQFDVRNVDANTGGALSAYKTTMHIRKDSGTWEYQYYTSLDNINVYASGWTTGYADAMFCSFAIGLFDDRQYMSMRSLFGWDETNENSVFEIGGDVAMSDVSTNPSHEFLISIQYYVHLHGNTEGRMWIEQFDMVTNDFFKELIELVTKGPMAYFQGKVVDGLEGAIFGIFEGLFEHLGKFIAWAFEAVLEYFPEEFRTWITGLMDDIAGLWDGLWEAFTTVIDNIWAEIENWIDDIIDDGLTELMKVLTRIADLISGIVFEAWDSSWTALGLNIPDLLGVIEAVSWFTIEVVTSFPDWVDDINDLQAFWTFEKIVVLLFIFLIFIPFMMGTSNKDGFSNIAKVNSYQIALVPIGVLLFVIAGALGLF